MSALDLVRARQIVDELVLSGGFGYRVPLGRGLVAVLRLGQHHIYNAAIDTHCNVPEVAVLSARGQGAPVDVAPIMPANREAAGRDGARWKDATISTYDTDAMLMAATMLVAWFETEAPEATS